VNHSCNQVNKSATGRAEVHGRDCWQNLRERDHLENVGVDGRIRLKWILKKCYGGVDWIYLAQDNTGGGAVANTIIKIQIPQNSLNFLTSKFKRQKV